MKLYYLCLSVFICGSPNPLLAVRADKAFG